MIQAMKKERTKRISSSACITKTVAAARGRGGEKRRREFAAHCNLFELRV